MKTGNMFSCRCTSECELRETVRTWNRVLSSRGVRVLPLKYVDEKALIYIYRPRKLKCDLANEAAAGILREYGYSAGTPERSIARLICRIADGGEFPHEIGLFLGYPPEDVSGFIENRAGGCKCVGSWKVYGDAEAAKKTFAKYKKCTRVYCEQYAKGRSIERLTVVG